MTSAPTIRLVAPERLAARLADALRKCGVVCEDGGRAVVVSSAAFADAAETAAILKTLGENAIVAAQIPPQFPFASALTARAEEMWNRPPVVIPPLRTAADFADAAQILAAALSSDSESVADSDAKTDSDSCTESAEDDSDFAPKTSPAEAVARARRALEDVL